MNVDFTSPMLKELDQEATALNVSRQAVIRTLLSARAGGVSTEVRYSRLNIRVCHERSLTFASVIQVLHAKRSDHRVRKSISG